MPISVRIAVAVLVLVLVAVGLRHIEAVQHRTDDHRADTLECLVGVLEVVVLADPGPGHHNGGVALGREQNRVGGRQNRRRVEDDHVEAFPEPGDAVAHGLRAEQLRRVRCMGARRNNVQVVDARRIRFRIERILLEQQLDEPRLTAHAKLLVNRWPAKVRIYKQYAAPSLGHHNGKIGGRHRLAIRRAGARHNDGLDHHVGPAELDARPQRPVRLTGHRHRIQKRDDPGVERSAVHHDGFRPTEILRYQVVHARNGSENGIALVPQVVRAVDAVVEPRLGRRQGNAQGEPQHQAQHNVPPAVRAERRGRRGRRTDNLGIPQLAPLCYTGVIEALQQRGV